MSLLRLCLGGLIKEDVWAWNSPCQQEVNIRTPDNSILLSESSQKPWNQEHFTLTFSKQPQPGRRNIPTTRPSELQITVPRYDKRKLEEAQKTAHKWTRYSLRKFYQRPFIYSPVRKQSAFRRHHTPKTHPGKAESKKSEDDPKKTTFQKDSKNNTGPHETTLESKKTVNDKKPQRGNEAYQTPSKSSRENKLSEKPKYKSETNLESKYSLAILMKDPIKHKSDSKKLEVIDTKSICPMKDVKSLKNNSDGKSKMLPQNSPNMDLMMYLEESGAESMEFDMWFKNYSQNNSKKTSKKEDKKSSDVETVESKDAKKDKKISKKDVKKKNAKKDTESTDAEFVDSKDAKKESKKIKKGSRKDNKKKDAKDTESTETESVDLKAAKKESKKIKKGSRKDDKKKDTKKDTESTDAESEPELKSKTGKKESKKDKKGAQKGDKKKDAKDTESTDADSESEWKSKKGDKVEKKAKRDSKKDAKKHDERKGIESTTSAESDDSSKRDPKKFGVLESSDAEPKESIYKSEAEKRRADESGPTSTDSKTGAPGQMKESKISFKKTTFQGQETKTVIGRVPPSRDRSPFLPCEPLILSSPKVKCHCRCKTPPPPPKRRYAPLPEAKWIHKLL